MNLISIGQIVDKTFHLYEKHFGDYMRIAAWMLLGIPLMIVSMVLFPLAETSLWGTAIAVGIVLFNGLLVVCVGYGIFGAVVSATVQFETGKKPFSTARPQLPKIIGRLFVQGIALGVLVIAACALVLPGVGLFVLSAMREQSGVILPSLGMFFLFFGGVAATIASVYCIVVFPMAPLSLLLEEQGVLESIRHAFALVKGRWWATMLRVLVPKLTLLVIVLFVQLLIALFIFVLSAAIVPLAEFVSEEVLQIGISSVSQILSACVAAITTPAFIIADYYVFQSLIATRRNTS